MINSFSGEYAWLSNFYEAPIRDEHHLTYPTVEHYFQAKKAVSYEDMLEIARAATPGEAKKLGRRVYMRHDWEQIKLGVMETALRKKFSIPELRDKLIATGDEELIEGNWWHDTFWGVCEGQGQNNLGLLLMKLRSELQEGRSLI